MNKFKVGDRVRRTTDNISSSLPVGSTVTVRCFINNSHIGIEETGGGWMTSKFELISRKEEIINDYSIY